MNLLLLILSYLSISITFYLTPLTIFLAKKFGFVDDYQKRPHPAHTHKGIIPRAGGLPIFLGIFIPLLLLVPLTKQITGIIAGSFVLIIVGIWDDKKDRSPYLRLATNALAALLAIGAGVGIPYLTNPLGGAVIHLDQWIIPINLFGNHSIIVWADLFALIWIVWMMNTIGWSGGIDGQMPGFVAISSIVIGILSLRFISTDPSQIAVTLLAFTTAGAFLGFLPWNFFPQKIMPGYGGKTLAGFMLAVLSILSFSKLGTALLVLAIPIIDAVFILIKRIGSGKSPVFASSGHLHHHLLNLGWGKRRIAAFYWIVSAITGIAALTLNSQQKIFAFALVVVLISGFIFWISILKKEFGDN